MTDSTAFSTTHYHIPDQCAVDRANSFEQEDAREAAIEKQYVTNKQQADNKRLLYEQRDTARLRGNHALEKETLKKVRRLYTYVICLIALYIEFFFWGGGHYL